MYMEKKEKRMAYWGIESLARGQGAWIQVLGDTGKVRVKTNSEETSMKVQVVWTLF